MTQRRLRISGRVQGVGFRASTLREAQRYPGLRGWVRNLDDGRVEAVAAGPVAEVEALILWCRKGPSRAEVTQLEVIEEAIDPSLGPFRIERG